MKRILLALVATLALAGCSFGSVASAPPPPAELANRTVLDEQAALAVELAYKATRLAGETALDAGLIKGDTARRLADIDMRAYSAVLAVRAAYRAGNAETYTQALIQARAVIAEVVAATRKGT
ncbi:lipoprotein [Novosphingobium sp.]|uniref:lipoprotein n=1 Tax=Novosphingobium sp. TaxID=1874826 RepID=UPI00286DD233|nr:lipoprotein [Novosphingobium sp.]